MLGLPQKVGGADLAVHAVVGNDKRLGRPGQQVDAYAAEQLGDVVYVDLPKVGQKVTAGSVVGEIESTKSVGELFAPASGTVTATNDSVVASPELVNHDALGQGWLIKMTIDEAPTLLTADEYAALTGE